MIETKYIAKPRLKEILSHSKYKQLFPSQKDFASAVGVKDPTISRFDSQTRYDINTLISISRELDIKVEDLFVIEENPDFIKPEKQLENEKEYVKNTEHSRQLLKYLLENGKIKLPEKEENTEKNTSRWKSSLYPINHIASDSEVMLNKMIYDYYSDIVKDWRKDNPTAHNSAIELDEEK